MGWVLVGGVTMGAGPYPLVSEVGNELLGGLLFARTSILATAEGVTTVVGSLQPIV